MISLEKIFGVVLSIIVLVSCAGSNEALVSDKISASVLEEYKINDLVVKSYDFENFEKFLQIQDDQVYVVNLWATWCQPCVEELPYFESINTTYKHKGVNVILASLDMPKTVESRLFPFIKDNDIRSEVILLNDKNFNSWIPKLDKNWDGAIPVTIIYNKEKKQFYSKTFSLQELQKEVEKFL